MGEDEAKAVQPPKFTWAQAFRDIVVTAMSTGQFPVFAMFFIIVFIIYKLPEKDVSVLARSILVGLKQGEGSAYGLLLFLSYFGYVYFRRVRSSFKAELENLAQENTDLRRSLTALKKQENELQNIQPELFQEDSLPNTINEVNEENWQRY